MRVRAEHTTPQHRVGVCVCVGLERRLLGRRWVHDSHLLAVAEVSSIELRTKRRVERRIEQRVERRAAAETGAAVIGAAHRCCTRRRGRRRERGCVTVELLEPTVDLDT